MNAMATVSPRQLHSAWKPASGHLSCPLVSPIMVRSTTLVHVLPMSCLLGTRLIRWTRNRGAASPTTPATSSSLVVAHFECVFGGIGADASSGNVSTGCDFRLVTLFVIKSPTEVVLRRFSDFGPEILALCITCRRPTSCLTSSVCHRASSR